MRIFAIYFFVALATSGLSLKANANSNFKLSPEVEYSNWNLNSNVTPEPTQLIAPELLAQATTFSDVQGNWAQSFIETLVAQKIIQGFPDGSFRPDEPVTRAQFAAMLNKAFPQNPTREAIAFVDVPANYWASEAIQQAYQTGFMQGYPNSVFNPNQNIPRVQVLVALANGLNLAASTTTMAGLNTYFQDASQIPDYARNSVAAAAEKTIVVNYPTVNLLNPNQIATRADVAALIYQALASRGSVPQLAASNPVTQYIVGYQPPAAQPAPNQQLEALQEQFLLAQPVVQERIIPRALGIPGSSVGSPSAFGAEWGDLFAGVSFQSRTRFTNAADGAVVAGFGLGNARTAVGLEVAVTVFDLLDNTFERGGVSFKVHRILGEGLAIAAGVENAIIWGESDTDSSAYGVVSKIFRFRNPAEPFSSLTVNLGLGGGRFRSEDDVFDGNDTINVFGSVGLRVVEPVSVIADWTGQDLNLGASIVPFRNIPLTITPAVADVTNNAGDGARFVLSIGYGLSLTPPVNQF
ncbi:S-layer homology domain-containing protein [Chroococcidiopsis sp. CCMEE 29]|uniref:S-layer homology domain-containing protein n=1 Tax=Chroococcidiopsis sp. CCMEE 29 TaxID=155894 RepID=UPI0020203F17|nr:S-layer homology domain-containing protein [Chroococcidiopsis sp. CCMEE 29]